MTLRTRHHLNSRCRDVATATAAGATTRRATATTARQAATAAVDLRNKACRADDLNEPGQRLSPALQDPRRAPLIDSPRSSARGYAPPSNPGWLSETAPCGPLRGHAARQVDCRTVGRGSAGLCQPRGLQNDPRTREQSCQTMCTRSLRWWAVRPRASLTPPGTPFPKPQRRSAISSGSKSGPFVATSSTGRSITSRSLQRSVSGSNSNRAKRDECALVSRGRNEVGRTAAWVAFRASIPMPISSPIRRALRAQVHDTTM